MPNNIATIDKSVIECDCVFCDDGKAFKKKDDLVTVPSVSGKLLRPVRFFKCFDCKQKFFKFLSE